MPHVYVEEKQTVWIHVTAARLREMAEELARMEAQPLRPGQRITLPVWESSGVDVMLYVEQPIDYR